MKGNEGKWRWMKGIECKWRWRNVDEVNEDVKLVGSLLKTGLE